jgi:hypothetical protein
MKFKFTSQEKLWGDELGSLRTVEFEQECLDDIISEFELFLKGSGFVFDRISIESNESNEYEDSSDLFEDEDCSKVYQQIDPLDDLSNKEKQESSRHTPKYYGTVTLSNEVPDYFNKSRSLLHETEKNK